MLMRQVLDRNKAYFQTRLPGKLGRPVAVEWDAETEELVAKWGEQEYRWSPEKALLGIRAATAASRPRDVSLHYAIDALGDFLGKIMDRIPEGRMLSSAEPAAAPESRPEEP